MTNGQDILNKLGHPRILVLGDVMLDRYTYGSTDRISPEAPVPILRIEQEESRLGGAAGVAYLLKHLGAEVFLAGVVGNDAEGRAICSLLQAEGIDDCHLLIDDSRPTTVKHRLVSRRSGQSQQVLRVDHETCAPISEQLAAALETEILERLPDLDAILVSDYLKGVCDPELLYRIIHTARFESVPVLVDPGRTTDYVRYHGATVLKPNRTEAELLLDHDFHKARDLCQTLSLECLLITLDQDGMLAVTPTDQMELPASPSSVRDITGAGDMVLAAMGLCLASRIPLPDAIRFANIAAGKEVERYGVSPITREEIVAVQTPDKCVTRDEAIELAVKYRKIGKKIVFTNGCFDLLHAGHVSHLQEAATLGDVLFVAINSDSSVCRLKGEGRPVIGECERSRMLAAIDCVTHVLIFDGDTPHDLLWWIRPHILVKGGTTTDIVGRQMVEAYGGRVCRTSSYNQISTTRIIEAIREPAT